MESLCFHSACTWALAVHRVVIEGEGRDFQQHEDMGYSGIEIWGHASGALGACGEAEW